MRPKQVLIYLMLLQTINLNMPSQLNASQQGDQRIPIKPQSSDRVFKRPPQKTDNPSIQTIQSRDNYRKIDSQHRLLMFMLLVAAEQHSKRR